VAAIIRKQNLINALFVTNTIYDFEYKSLSLVTDQLKYLSRVIASVGRKGL